jgi:DNA-binding response OmpR family regulator
MTYQRAVHPKPHTSDERRCLIVEDEALISIDLENIVNSYGVRLVDIAHTLANALALVQVNSYDIALLDLNIGSTSILPVADVLAMRKTPFGVISGWASDIPPVLKGVPFVSKPFSEENVIDIIIKLLPSLEGTLKL